MYNYSPYSDQEDFFGGGLEDVYNFTRFPLQTPAHDPEETETFSDYVYIPHPHEPQVYDPSVGGAPLDSSHPQFYFHELPFNCAMDTGCFQDPNLFDLPSVMSGSSPQEHFHSHYMGSQPYTDPHPVPVSSTAMPTAPSELDDSTMLELRCNPRGSPRAASRISGPSTPSPLNTFGVALYSHSPTTPLERASQSPGFAGPGSASGTGSRQSPISPSQKRSLEPSADDSLPGRRVIPRQAGSSNVHSAPIGGTDMTTSSITSRVPDRGPTIPQHLYNVGNTHSFHFSANNGMIVTFDVARENGIPLHQLLDRQSFLLQERDDLIPMSGDTASIRIEWPGYPSFCKQIASKDWKKTRTHNTRGRLAMKVAGAVKAFIQKHANTPCDPPNSMWHIGPGGIRIEDLVLVSLHRVSQGSWQPKLCLLHNNGQG